MKVTEDLIRNPGLKTCTFAPRNKHPFGTAHQILCMVFEKKNTIIVKKKMSSTVKRLVVINWHFNLYTSELVLCSSICNDYHRLSSSSVVSVLRENDSGLQLRRHKIVCGSEHQVPSCL